eukprot:5677444-Pyramimonas_sp.AAC.1
MPDLSLGPYPRPRGPATWAATPRIRDVWRCFADAPRGAQPCGRVSAGSRPRIKTARARMRICPPL